MSRRTAEASKVIVTAWNNEKQLVLEGKGTRNWTKEQQQTILDKGKAYDDNGKAFEGHHMKSVERYPEYQGDAGNIQFLNRQEHKEAHGGNFQNPTNGYFNPVTKITDDFGDNPFVPCNIIELSEPVVFIDSFNDENSKINNDEKINEDAKSDTKINGPLGLTNQEEKFAELTVMDNITKASGIKKALGSVADFYLKHQDVINPIIEIGGPIIGGLILKTKRNQKGTQNKSVLKTKVSPVKAPISAEKVKKVVDRAAPTEHIVPAHRQRYNGVWKDKAQYTRGGKK